MRTPKVEAQPTAVHSAVRRVELGERFNQLLSENTLWQVSTLSLIRDVFAL